jgi:hypothetical protein
MLPCIAAHRLLSLGFFVASIDQSYNLIVTIKKDRFSGCSSPVDTCFANGIVRDDEVGGSNPLAPTGLPENSTIYSGEARC